MGVVKRPAISVEIDELVLHGFPPGERYRIAESVAAELTRILADRGLPEPVAAPPHGDTVRGGSFTLRHADGGAQIAAAIYRGLQHGG
jgi:hypothetical protein